MIKEKDYVKPLFSPVSLEMESPFLAASGMVENIKVNNVSVQAFEDGFIDTAEEEWRIDFE